MLTVSSNPNHQRNEPAVQSHSQWEAVPSGLTAQVRARARGSPERSPRG